jgi:hypothetical protein
MSIGISLPDKLVPFPVWQKKDGPIPFVFSAKKPGNQCAWSCVWFCALGKVIPDDWATVENMGLLELYHELIDVAARPGKYETQAIRLVKRFRDHEKRVRQVLYKARQIYPEYINRMNPLEPRLINVHIYRPDW